MKLISWNIDSLNAALLVILHALNYHAQSSIPWSLKMQTSLLFKRQNYLLKVLPKSICKSWKTTSLTMTILGVHLLNPLVKVMLEPCSCIKKN